MWLGWIVWWGEGDGPGVVVAGTMLGVGEFAGEGRAGCLRVDGERVSGLWFFCVVAFLFRSDSLKGLGMVGGRL